MHGENEKGASSAPRWLVAGPGFAPGFREVIRYLQTERQCLQALDLERRKKVKSLSELFAEEAEAAAEPEDAEQSEAVTEPDAETD